MTIWMSSEHLTWMVTHKMGVRWGEKMWRRDEQDDSGCGLNVLCFKNILRIYSEHCHRIPNGCRVKYPGLFNATNPDKTWSHGQCPGKKRRCEWVQNNFQNYFYETNTFLLGTQEPGKSLNHGLPTANVWFPVKKHTLERTNSIFFRQKSS